MQPTYLKYIKNAVKLPLKNITEYYPNEVFTEVIFYDGRILPWYYISNYGRIYSVHSKKIKNIQIDSYGYIRVHLSYEKNKSIYEWAFING